MNAPAADKFETFAEERTRVVREERLAKEAAYRAKHGIGKTQMYYHEDENMYRADYIEVALCEVDV
jgi:hypothetical protein